MRFLPSFIGSCVLLFTADFLSAQIEWVSGSGTIDYALNQGPGPQSPWTSEVFTGTPFSFSFEYDLSAIPSFVATPPNLLADYALQYPVIGHLGRFDFITSTGGQISVEGYPSYHGIIVSSFGGPEPTSSSGLVISNPESLFYFGSFIIGDSLPGPENLKLPSDLSTSLTGSVEFGDQVGFGPTYWGAFGTIDRLTVTPLTSSPIPEPSAYAWSFVLMSAVIVLQAKRRKRSREAVL